MLEAEIENPDREVIMIQIKLSGRCLSNPLEMKVSNDILHCNQRPCTNKSDENLVLTACGTSGSSINGCSMSLTDA